jgi:nucleotide-binding universal stress UspA family protein
VQGGWAASDLLEMIELDARQALTAASKLAYVRKATILRGDPAGCVIGHLRNVGASLVAAGTHGHTRAAGILVGTVATRLLHEALCSVLIARPTTDQDQFPGRILVGIDGSPQAANAGLVAQSLADRFGAECIGLVATGGKAIDLDAARASFPGTLEEFPARAAAALIEAAHEADLLVVGSRGLHGLRALGSVSERVAHRASCSALVVRPTETSSG